MLLASPGFEFLSAQDPAPGKGGAADNDSEVAEDPLLAHERDVLSRRMRIRVRDVARRIQVGERRAFALLDVVDGAVAEALKTPGHRRGTARPLIYGANQAQVDADIGAVIRTATWQSAWSDLLTELERERYADILRQRDQAVAKARTEFVLAVLSAELVATPIQLNAMEPWIAEVVKHEPESMSVALERLRSARQDELAKLLSKGQWQRCLVTRGEDAATHPPRYDRVDREQLLADLGLWVGFIARRFQLQEDDAQLLRDASRRGASRYLSGSIHRKRGLVNVARPKRGERPAETVLLDPVWTKLIRTVLGADRAVELTTEIAQQKSRRAQAGTDLMVALMVRRLGLDPQQAEALRELIARAKMRSSYQQYLTHVNLAPDLFLPLVIGRAGLEALKESVDDDQAAEIAFLEHNFQDGMIPPGAR